MSLWRIPPGHIAGSRHARTRRTCHEGEFRDAAARIPPHHCAGARKVMGFYRRLRARLRSAPRTGILAPPPRHARPKSATCEAGEACDAFRDRKPLQIGRELHLYDAGHAFQNHGGKWCPRFGHPATLGPLPRLRQEQKRGAGETPSPIGRGARRARARQRERAGLRTPGGWNPGPGEGDLGIAAAGRQRRPLTSLAPLHTPGLREGQRTEVSGPSSSCTLQPDL